MDILKTVSFLKALKANNNKEWLEGNRAEYNLLRKDFFKMIEDINFSSIKFDKTFEFYNPKKLPTE